MSAQRPAASLMHFITVLLVAATTMAAFAPLARAQQPTAALIVQRVDDSARAPLAGNVSGHIRSARDLGLAPGTLAMDELALVLKRAPAQELALEQLLSQQQDSKSAGYHKWLTPAQFGAQFGAADADVLTLTAWLQAHGFLVKSVTRGRNLLRFSGTAAQVEAAFNTQIHYFEANGERRWANVFDPQIPRAFVPAVAGIVGLHDFRPAPQHQRATALPLRARLAPQFNTVTAGVYAVGPADFATIYNVQPLFIKGITGAGAKIAVVSRSNIDTSAVRAYWSAFGVAANQTLAVVIPAGDTDPGETADENETEADLDVELAGGVARDATIILVASSSLSASIAYAIDANVAPIVSISFGECEADLTAAGNSQVATLYQEAAAAGISVVVSSGDQGAATCDVGDTTGPAPASHGLAVNGLASTPYNTAVGGTDFDFTGLTESQYWSATNASGTFASALSYMPEMAWNSSCANPVLLQVLPTYSSVEAICNNPSFFSFGVIVDGGGGGLSSVYAQPSWQAGLAGGAARALPDVAFFAANNFSGVSWVVCTYTNTTCDPNGSASTADGYELVGGTSASTPAFAAVLALLLQTQVSPGNPDGRQGLVNPLLYQLARAEFGTAQAPNTQALGSCNSANGKAVGSACVFHDVTSGSVAQPCATGSASCATGTSGDAYGVLSGGAAASLAAAPGFDVATGLGSLDVANFVTALWVPPAPAALAATAGEATVALKWTASQLAQSYDLYQGSTAGGEAAAPVRTGITGVATTVSGLTSGKAYFFRVAAINGGGASAYSAEAKATVLASVPTALTATAGNGSVSLSWGASSGASAYSVYRGTSPGSESATPVQSGLTGASATVSGLSNGQSYFFTVAAVNAGGSSAMSNEASATPAAPGGGGGGGRIGALELLALALAAGWACRERAGCKARYARASAPLSKAAAPPGLPWPRIRAGAWYRSRQLAEPLRKNSTLSR